MNGLDWLLAHLCLHLCTLYSALIAYEGVFHNPDVDKFEMNKFFYKARKLVQLYSLGPRTFSDMEPSQNHPASYPLNQTR